MTQQVMDRPAGNLPARQNGGNNRGLTLARDTQTLKGMLDASADKLAMVIPKHLTPERLMRVALVAVSRSELLQKCTVQSILQCVMTGGQLGLDCSGVLGSAYMVPFFNNKIKAYEATFIPGYRGLIDLARRSGEIEDIYAQVVYVGDEFDYELGATPRLHHKPNLTANRVDDDIVGAYMVAFLKGTSRPHIEFMVRDDIIKIRDNSKSYWKEEWVNGNKTGKKTPSGPWHDHFSEMARKTVVRRGVKYLPVSIELAEAIALDDAQYDRTEVQSAQTSSSGAARLNERVTRRPVSEGQTFEPDQDAAAAIAEQQRDEQASVNTETGEVVEPDVSGADAQPPTEDPADLVAVLDVAWEDAEPTFRSKMKEAGAKKQDIDGGIFKWGQAHSQKTEAERRELYFAVVEKRFDYAKGVIVTA